MRANIHRVVFMATFLSCCVTVLLAQDEISWRDEIILEGTFKYIRLCKVTKGPATGDIIMTYFQNEHSAPFAMRRSNDDGRTWSDETVFMRNSTTEYFVNPGILQLNDGRLMLSYCKRPKQPTRFTPFQGPCVRFSSDGGYTWGKETFIAWSGDYEPTAIQVPNDQNGDGHDDIYLFWSMAIVDQSFDLYSSPVEEVRRGFACGVVASYDNGVSWDNFMPTKLGARIIHRNFDYKRNSGYYMSKGNMPTPVLLPDHRIGVVCEAVDKASSPWFTVSDPGDWNWENLQGQQWTDYTYFGFPPYTSPHDTNVYPTNREQCFRPTFQDNTFGGAPYAAVMPNGRIVFTQNSGQKIKVFVADAYGRNAVRQQDPFPDRDNSFYSCIVPLNDKEVLVAAHNNIDNSQAFLRIGEIRKDTDPPATPVNLFVTVANNRYLLNWNASTDNIVVHKYEIYAKNQHLKTILWDTNASFDLSVTGSVSDFSIRAVDYQGNVSGFSSGVSSVDAVENQIEVDIYPIPVENRLNITTLSNDYSIQIISVDGKVLIHVHESPTFIDVSRLVKGNYTLRIVSHELTVSKKFSKL